MNYINHYCQQPSGGKLSWFSNSCSHDMLPKTKLQGTVEGDGDGDGHGRGQVWERR